jgi:chromosome segregation ATPase
MTTLDNRSDRIENAVGRELARRRRLLRLYLLLLLVPLGVAAWFLVAGRSDQESFRQAVEDRVAPVEQSYERIAPKLKQVESFDEALPIVQQAAEQLKTQEKQVATLQQQVEEIGASQTIMMRTIEPAGEVNELSNRLKKVEGSLQSIQAQQSEIQRDLTTVRQRIDRQPGRPVLDLDPQRLNELIDARIRVLERSRGERRDHRESPPPPR